MALALTYAYTMGPAASAYAPAAIYAYTVSRFVHTAAYLGLRAQPWRGLAFMANLLALAFLGGHLVSHFASA